LKLNIGCGDVFIEDKSWINVDWASSHRNVANIDIRSPLPFSDNSLEFVYASHLIEHLIDDDLNTLLQEIFRILKPGGICRLVTPDWDEMIVEYLAQRGSGNYLYANWVKTEILDQLVRLRPKGAIRDWKLQAEKDSLLRNYIRTRIGADYSDGGNSQKVVEKISLSRVRVFLSQPMLKKIGIVTNKIQKSSISLMVLAFPKWFRTYQISMTDPGEKHLWVFSFYEVEDLLSAVGFKSISKQTFDSTNYKDQSILELDRFRDVNEPRKGRQSMYVEARKAI
jgi:SAM-dependent methyltransferase